jgi:hypothetical protein
MVTQNVNRKELESLYAFKFEDLRQHLKPEAMFRSLVLLLARNNEKLLSDRNTDVFF